MPGCTNGLALRGKADCEVAVSVDRGRTWRDRGALRDGMDLTDHVKAQRQYFLRFGAGPRELAGTGLTILTVCQANAAVLPRLKDGGNTVRFEASRTAVVSAGPTVEQARTHVVGGSFQAPQVTLELATPRREPVLAVYGAAHVVSGNPPQPDVRYAIDCSTDGGQTWKPMVKDWTIPRRGEEPQDFWSQSFCCGSVEIAEKADQRPGRSGEEGVRTISRRRFSPSLHPQQHRPAWLARPFCTAGTSSAISTAMMAMTTSSSISENPPRRHCP